MLRDNETKQILENPTLMRHFVHRYVPAPWALRVREEHLEMLSTEHFLASRNRGQPPGRRVSDLICRIHHPDGAEHPDALLLLLEAQSTRDRWMPVRMLEYVSLTLRRHWSPTDPLPLVLPTVFYTGADPWNVPTALSALRPTTTPTLAHFQPQLRYLVVTLDTEGAWRPGEGRVFAALLQVLQAESSAEVTKRLAELIVEAERDGARTALDAIANALADVLMRRHSRSTLPQRVTTMEALMAKTREWIYTPGVPELREIIAEIQGDLERERAERERERALLVRMAEKLVPGLDSESARALSLDELQALIEEHA